MAGKPDRSNQRPIIIVKKKGKHHGGHHGGGWKVAYADFVTAMMAFFLLLWLLNVTTEEQRKGIADYFAPASLARSTSGASGLLDGAGLTPGKLPQSGGPPVAVIEIPAAEPTETDRENPLAQGEDGSQAEPKPQPTEQEIRKEIAKREEENFKRAEEAIRQAIKSVPELKQLAESLLVDRTEEGLRIQIVDQDKISMFPRGSSTMHDFSRLLMAQLAKVVQQLPNRIAISGHTDSTAYVNPNNYSNWELSADRANASRRALIAAGVPANRITRVVGRAEHEHLDTQDPNSPRNRRISIVLIREASEVAGAAATQDQKKGP
jgi:chemotaxis protein MotB